MIVDDPDLIEQNQDMKAFFYDEFAKGLLRHISKIIMTDDNLLDVIGVIVKQFTIIFARNIENRHLVIAMKNIFNYNCSLHLKYYQNLKPGTEEWRSKFKVGDRVECLKGGFKYKNWGIAIITFINQDTLELQFENDSNIYDKPVHRFSPEIAQVGKHSVENDWKHELRIGDEIDAYDKAKVWYRSTILAFRQYTMDNGRS